MKVRERGRKQRGRQGRRERKRWCNKRKAGKGGMLQRRDRQRVGGSARGSGRN